MDADSEEDAIEEAKTFYYNSVYNTRDMPNYAVVVGEHVGDCPEGDQIIVKKIIKAVKNRKNVPKKKALKKNKKRSEKKVVIPTEASEVVITDENTYEEESTCQEK